MGAGAAAVEVVVEDVVENVVEVASEVVVDEAVVVGLISWQTLYCAPLLHGSPEQHCPVP